MQETATPVLEGAEEFTLGDGPVAALLVHGFTGSPQGLRGLGEYLAERGIAVAAPRLPGHGTTWEDLNTRTNTEWVATVKDAYESLAKSREQVFIAALSFGAALAIDFVARNPDRVSGLVTMAGFVQSKDPRRLFAPVIRRLTRSIPGVGNDICDPNGNEICYDRLPTSATYSMLKMIKRARAELPLVRCPVLIMHGRNDHTVAPFNAQVIHDHVGSTDKQLVWMERSYHVITLDNDRDEVFERTYGFIKDHSAL